MDIQLKTADFNRTIETNKNVVLDFMRIGVGLARHYCQS